MRQSLFSQKYFNFYTCKTIFINILTELRYKNDTIGFIFFFGDIPKRIYFKNLNF